MESSDWTVLCYWNSEQYGCAENEGFGLDSALDYAPSLHSFLLYTLREKGCACCTPRDSIVILLLLAPSVTTYSINKMAQRYVGTTIDDMSMLSMGEW